MKYFIAVFLLASSANAWCCSCWGLARIEEAIATEPILVEGQVVSLEQTDSPGFGKLTLSATLRVAKVLKGSVDTQEITVVRSMCAATLTPAEMELHHSYVLPLAEPAPERAPSERGEAVAVVGPAPGQYEMPGCSHSGLELIEGDLYTFEYDGGPQARLQRYMSYSAFRGWWPVAAAAVGTTGYVIELYRTFGLSALIITLILSTAVAYFAARYRPWLLIPVLLLAILLCVLNLASALGPRANGTIYWVLSWIAPAIIIGGVFLGYMARRRPAVQS